ncbi:VESICLE-ASSOCIATED PROTEIN 1-3 [Salix purpurea]|uniref:VESICLE-ASSOCIATED PROTEIN 1-3 n=1 Tax=Salix purpurea TaxID=77065 RepID=A0A9Q0P0M5_SALPP|nr:VESICLE-ASSOCIATED PROTEIN 1-3 [Salix purpurea]
MSTGDLHIHPTELKFPFELKKQSSCSMQLTNKSDKYVVFKVKTTNPKKYCVRPNTGVVMPGSTCRVTFTMQAQKEAPPDMQCKDKFLLQSVVAPDGTTTKDITSDMFIKEDGKLQKNLMKGCSPSRPSVFENGNQDTSLLDAVSRSLEEPKEKSSETWSVISRLTEEKTSALQQNQKLQQELELMRKQVSKKYAGGASLLVVFLVGLFGTLVGYIFK